MSVEDQLQPERAAALSKLFANLPDSSYQLRYAAVQKLRKAFLREVAAALEGPLNQHLSRVIDEIPNTPEAKQDLASWINEHLRQVNLAVCCPRTALPAIIAADRQDAENPDIARFRFRVRDASTGGHRSTLAASRIPVLHLIEHPVRIEPFSRGYRKANESGPAR